MTDTTSRSIQGMSGPRGYLHADGVALLAGSILAYALTGGRWWLFAALILAPDVFMLGYVAGPAIGAAVYNAGHTSFVPLALITIGVITGRPLAVEVGIIWAAHIGMDHAFGYGFKYASRFKDTHFVRV